MVRAARTPSRRPDAAVAPPPLRDMPWPLRDDKLRAGAMRSNNNVGDAAAAPCRAPARRRRRTAREWFTESAGAAPESPRGVVVIAAVACTAWHFLSVFGLANARLRRAPAAVAAAAAAAAAPAAAAEAEAPAAPETPTA
jgi:hypothetical protein